MTAALDNYCDLMNKEWLGHVSIPLTLDIMQLDPDRRIDISGAHTNPR